MLLAFALLALFLAIYTFWEASRRRKATGIPRGRLIYSDTSRWQVQEEPLYDEELGLSGRPDYIFEDGRYIIPVEIKSSRPPESPYASHILQLAAYCLLIERNFHKRPPYGVLHYRDRNQETRTFAVDYTAQLEFELTSTVAEMRTRCNWQEIPPSHSSKARCAACGYRSICDQRLA